MSQLISRILLAMLVFPLAAVLYLVLVIVGMEGMRSTLGWSPNRDMEVFLVSGVVTSAFIGLYWCVLWYRVVRWTPARRIMTLLAGGGAALAGLLAGVAVAMVMSRNDHSFSVFVGTVLTPLMWLVSSIFIWRETAAERKERLAGAREAVVCPTCGYNLTGLLGTRCPECGAQFTLDELMRSQPGKAVGELEGG